MTFAERLQALKQKNLSTADLAFWFDRPWPTVYTWEKGRYPRGNLQAEVQIRLSALEIYGQRRKHIVPFELTQQQRMVFLKDLKRDLVLRGDTAE